MTLGNWGTGTDYCLTVTLKLEPRQMEIDEKFNYFCVRSAKKARGFLNQCSIWSFQVTLYVMECWWSPHFVVSRNQVLSQDHKKSISRTTHRRLWYGTVHLRGDRSCLPGFQCLISLCPATESVQLCSLQGQDKNQSPDFLLHIKVQCFGTHRWLLSSLSPHPGCLACSQLFQWQSPCGCWLCGC